MKKLLLIALLIVGCASINKIDYKQNKKKIIVETEALFQNGIIIESRDYYENGIIKEEISYKDGKLNGVSKEYYENGSLKSESTFKDGVLDGKVIEYYPKWINSYLYYDSPANHTMIKMA